MIISSWNVNSIRARILNVQEYLKKFNPDIVLTQEIKTQEETYPFDDIKKLKYESYVFGQKSYNGVAILSKKKLDKIEKDIFLGNKNRIINNESVYISGSIDKDIILIEGLKNMDYPKIEVHQKKVSKEILCEKDSKIIAFVSDLLLDLKIPCFDINNINSIVNFIVEYKNSCVKKNNG